MFSQKIRSCLKLLVIFTLAVVLVLGDASQALAARTGGRIGGGSFSAPSRSYSPPRGGGGYGYPGGGGIGFPFLLPFFGFGGAFGGIFTLLIFMALINFLVSTLRNFSSPEAQTNTTQVSVAELQVGLYANARGLQQELDQIAEQADTNTGSGRGLVLQEATLALLRHPEYWVYGASQSQQTYLEAAEAKFNQLALAERSKFTSETLSNVNNELRQGEIAVLSPEQAEGEYILVTLLVGYQGKLQLPTINGDNDLRQALQQIGGLGGDRLLAIEVLWTPQAPGDTLSRDDLVAQYPNLKLV